MTKREMMPTKNKTESIQAQKPKEKIPEIDLSAKIYPITEYVDETGKVVAPHRSIYECGDCDGEGGIREVEFEGYRTIKPRTRLVSQTEMLEAEQVAEREERELLDLNRRALPIIKGAVKGGSITIYGHEFVPHTKINDLLTQNPVISSGTDRRFGYVEDGCGENKSKHLSPSYHPISTAPHYQYWDEGKYQRIFDIGDKSLDTYYLIDALDFKCDVTGRWISSHIIYHNPNNNQVSVWCQKCFVRGEKWPWHRITDHEVLEKIGAELGIELVRYKKAETEKNILELVRNSSGICIDQISQELDISKDKVKRGVTRLKKKHKIRARIVGKTTRIYPI